MSNPVLLLDAAWRIDRVIGAQHACELIASGRAVQASEHVAAVFRSPSTTIEVPEVIASIGGVHRYQRKPPSCSLRRIRQRDDHVCQFVIDGRPCERRGASVDHLLPRSRGGPLSWDNLVAACISHNHMKADRSLDEMGRFGWALRRDPFVPTREEVLAASLTRPPAGWIPFLPAAA